MNGSSIETGLAKSSICGPTSFLGRITIFEFTSSYCPACLQVDSTLRHLAQNRPAVAVRQLDINRAGVVGIDFASPLVRQYKLEGVPYFIVFDSYGKEVASGAVAERMVMKWAEDAEQRLHGGHREGDSIEAR